MAQERLLFVYPRSPPVELSPGRFPQADTGGKPSRMNASGQGGQGREGRRERGREEEERRWTTYLRHSREAGIDRMRRRRWIPACARMTILAVIPAKAGIHLN